ncbi:hypothetical protein [endosymbiont 'TC1' of Trimyema compressum]|nr:hypothetical protein [endosymbiont 'TC1' of Trimyema compressum]
MEKHLNLQQGMTRKQANEIMKKVLPKYEEQLLAPPKRQVRSRML